MTDQVITSADAALRDAASAWLQLNRDAAADRTAEAERAALEQQRRRELMTVEDAKAKYEGLTRDADFMKKYIAGDADARRLMDDCIARKMDSSEVDRFMSGTLSDSGYVAPGISVHDAKTIVEDYRTAGIGEEVILHALKGEPVTAKERAEAQRLRERRLADPDWTAAMLQKRPEQMEELHLLSIILSSPVSGAA